MIRTIGQREAERALQLGVMYSAEEALAVGLIDKVVAPEDLIDEAKKELGRFLNVDGKLLGRDSVLDNDSFVK